MDIKKMHPASKSQEYYFGEANPLKMGIISCIERMREISRDAKDNGATTPQEIVIKLKDASEDLCRLVEKSFNIEHCAIGWENEINAACFVNIFNEDILKDVGNEKTSTYEFITVTKDGFKYKNKKGISYLFLIGYPIFADCDSVFTVEEATACFLHECGHAMEHILHGILGEIALNEYRRLYQSLEIENLPDVKRKEIMRLLEEMKKIIDSGDKKALEALGKSINDKNNGGIIKNGGVSFSTINAEELNETRGDFTKDKNKDLKDTYDNNTKKSLKESVSMFFKSLKFLFTKIFFGETMTILHRYRHLSEMDASKTIRYAEEFADNFASIYGCGVSTASLQLKFYKYFEIGRIRRSLLERVPLLDLFWSVRDLAVYYYAALDGYPVKKERMLNAYRACVFELKNNKDLTQEQRKELEKQIDEYKKFYDKFVDLENDRGRFYKKLAGIRRRSIEEAAKRDKNVEKNVLIPLQKIADPNFVSSDD